MAAESNLETSIVRYCKLNGIYTRKFSSPSHRGVPDRVFIRNAMVLFLEIKAPGKKPTPLQMEELEQICAYNGLASWVDNMGLAMSFLGRLGNISRAEMMDYCLTQNAK